MIPKPYRKLYQDRKWSPFWTANDPEKKVKNGMEGGMVWTEN